MSLHVQDSGFRLIRQYNTFLNLVTIPYGDSKQVRHPLYSTASQFSVDVYIQSEFWSTYVYLSVTKVNCT